MVNCVLSHVKSKQVLRNNKRDMYKLIKNSIIQLKMHKARFVLSEAL